MRKSTLAVALSFTTAVSVSHAQMAHRLKGSLRATGGTPIANGQVRADNLSGFRGEPFAGQKDHVASANDKGEWNITGIEAGLWLFSSSAGKNEEAAQAITVGLGPEVPTETRVAAGELALLLKQDVLAKTIFSMALQKEPKHPRATLGSAGAALLARDWEAAGRIIWDARDLVPKEQRQALAAAIDDLRAIARVQ